MINAFRILLSISAFLGSVYIIICMILYSFNLVALIISLIGFILAHYLWPTTSSSSSSDSCTYPCHDGLIHSMVELPFTLLTLIIRGVFNIFKAIFTLFDN